jgi:hypothetical protein
MASLSQLHVAQRGVGFLSAWGATSSRRMLLIPTLLQLDVSQLANEVRLHAASGAAKNDSFWRSSLIGSVDGCVWPEVQIRGVGALMSLLGTPVKGGKSGSYKGVRQLQS